MFCFVVLHFVADLINSIFVADRYVEYTTVNGQCKWWRLSFSAIEKEIVKHADGTHCRDDTRTCRKDVLRLLKDDLVNFYENNRLCGKSVCSYFMKTIVLHVWEEEHSWADTDLRLRYVNALERTVQCLNEKHIEHFFIEGENLFDEKEVSDRDLKPIREYFRGILNSYSVY